MQTHIFGAGAGIGRWFASRPIFSTNSTYVYDIHRRHIEELKQLYGDRAKMLDVSGAVAGDYLRPVAGEFRKGDLFVLAIPESQLDSLCRSLNRHIPDGCAVCVMTSRQEQPIAQVKQLCDRARVFGLHPLFGPTVPEPHGQAIALCDQATDWRHSAQLVKLLEKSGLTVVVLPSGDHDRQMASIQALTHFTLLAFAGAVASGDFKWKELMLLKTPPFQFLSAFAARILMATPATYATIQASEYAAEARGRLLSSISAISDAIDAGNLANFIERLREPFTGSTLSEFSQFSFIADRAVHAREKFYFELLDTKQVCVFRHVSRQDHRIGRVLKVNSTSIEIEEYTTKTELSGRSFFAVPFDECSLSAYRKLGIKLSSPKVQEFKKSNVLFMSSADAKQWLDENVLCVQSTISTPNPSNYNESFFEKISPMLIEEILRCEFVDSFRRKGEMTRATVLVTHHPSVERETIENKLRSVCYGEELI
ncbi:MAG: prephenate dehydrogenase/arogenate dehydrogenase family protein [Sphingobium sp.]